MAASRAEKSIILDLDLNKIQNLGAASKFACAIRILILLNYKCHPSVEDAKLFRNIVCLFVAQS